MMDELLKQYPAMAKAFEGIEDLPPFDKDFVDNMASGLAAEYRKFLAVPENNAEYKKWLKNKRRREKRHQAKLSNK